MDFVPLAWLATGVAAIVFAAFAFLRAAIWIRIARSTGYLWAGALAAVVVACVVGNFSRSLWPWAARVTFAAVDALLAPILPGLMADLSKMTIGTERFSVEIAPECSGLEGVGLMLAFGVMWLTLFRKQCRFPQSLILLPLGVVAIFLLNSARIAALILIGNAGAARIAAGGFHSQAGWIIFNFVALGFSVAASRVPWIHAAGPVEAAGSSERFENPTAAWLTPFIAILAAGMISRTLSADFEWLYPLRFFAACAALIFFRRTYLSLDWRVSWYAPAIGTLVFFLWMGLDRSTAGVRELAPSALLAAPALGRNIWLTFRVVAAVVTVPIAEELAFRGFLYRRLLAADFETIPLRRFSWLALVASSAIFGMLHGGRWFAGGVAGAMYALAMIRRGRIADAVVAHAVTNALIAGEVLALQRWHLW